MNGVFKEELSDLDTCKLPQSFTDVTVKTLNDIDEEPLSETSQTTCISNVNVAKKKLGNNLLRKVTTKTSSNNHKTSKDVKMVKSRNAVCYKLSSKAIVYTKKLNDMTFPNNNINIFNVHGKRMIKSIYKQSKPKLTPDVNIGQLRTYTKKIIRTYSRLKNTKKAASVRLTDESLNKPVETVKEDGVRSSSTENSTEQVRDNICPGNSVQYPIHCFKTKINKNPESRHTKLMSKILVHNPKLCDGINNTQNSLLLQSKETECDIIEADIKLEAMITDILDDSSREKSIGDNEDPYQICCWYKREQLADNQSNILRIPHECVLANCACCCKPKEELLVIKPDPLNSPHTSKLKLANPQNLNIDVRDTIPKFNSSVVHTLEALKGVNFSYNKQGKLVANLASPINNYETTVLSVLDRIFSIVSDKITAHGFTNQDKISIGLCNTLNNDYSSIQQNTTINKNKEITKKSEQSNTEQILPNSATSKSKEATSKKLNKPTPFTKQIIPNTDNSNNQSNPSTSSNIGTTRTLQHHLKQFKKPILLNATYFNSQSNTESGINKETSESLDKETTSNKTGQIILINKLIIPKAENSNSTNKTSEQSKLFIEPPDSNILPTPRMNNEIIKNPDESRPITKQIPPITDDSNTATSNGTICKNQITSNTDNSNMHSNKTYTKRKTTSKNLHQSKKLKPLSNEIPATASETLTATTTTTSNNPVVLKSKEIMPNNINVTIQSNTDTTSMETINKKPDESKPNQKFADTENCIRNIITFEDSDESNDEAGHTVDDKITHTNNNSEYINRLFTISNTAAKKRRHYIASFKSFLRYNNTMTVSNVQSLPTIIDIDDPDPDETEVDRTVEVHTHKKEGEKREVKLLPFVSKIRVLDPEKINLLKSTEDTENEPVKLITQVTTDNDSR